MIFVVLYIWSGDIVIMLGKLRIVFYVVFRIVKVGNENEFLFCLKWKDGFFINDVILFLDLDEISILDENVKFLDVVEEKIVVS